MARSLHTCICTCVSGNISSRKGLQKSAETKYKSCSIYSYRSCSGNNQAIYLVYTTIQMLTIFIRWLFSLVLNKCQLERFAKLCGREFQKLSINSKAQLS